MYMLICTKTGIFLVRKEFMQMKALFESNAFFSAENISAIKYKHLHNLPHWHIEYELVFVLEGSAELMVNDNLSEMHKGNCAFINSEDVHYIKATPESVIGVIKADAVYVKKIIGNRQLSSHVITCIPDILNVFESAYVEIRNKKELYNIASELIVARFFIDLFRKETDLPQHKNNKQITHKYKDLLEMLANNYAYISFENAASYVNLNKSYFSKYFHRLTGMTFTQYLNTLKVSNAIEKIHKGNMNMTEISISCGFGTIRNFNRVFKSLTGYSPKKLPNNYFFIYNLKESSKEIFNPTLNCTEIIE